MNDKLDDEWLDALEVETPDDTGADDNVPDDDKPLDDNTNADDTGAEDEETKDDDADDDSGSDDDSGDDDNATDGRDDEDEEIPDEKASTKEAIKEALQEIDTAKKVQSDTIQALKKEVEEALYPEGIDRQLRDSDGDPITGIDDLTKLINPRTGELFTDEEAGAWLLSAQQRLNKDVEAVENFIEQVAEVNANVKSGAERVADKYGAILSKDDKLRARLLDAYDKTLVKDPKTGITINNPVDVEEFFDIALEDKLNEFVKSEEEAKIKAAKEAKLKAEQDAKANQNDRGDLKPSGKSDELDPEDKEWAQAIKDYEKGA